MSQASDTAPRLTNARLRALNVLSLTGTARRSDHTGIHRTAGRGPEAFVYWQTAEWLVEHGLARFRHWNDDRTYAGADGIVEITAAGRRELARAKRASV